MAFLKSLKADPNQLLVAAITGPSSPYTLVPDVDGDLTVAHSCTAAAGQYADPSISVQQWVEGFGNHGLLQTICGNSFAPALTSIATEVAKAMGPPCIDAPLLDTDLATPGLQPDCQTFDQYFQYFDGTGHLVRSELQACAANGNTPPCWALVADAGRCAGGSLFLNVNRAAGALPNGLSTLLSCALCIPGVSVAGCP